VRFDGDIEVIFRRLEPGDATPPGGIAFKGEGVRR
jgi:hypothetical protein